MNPLEIVHGAIQQARRYTEGLLKVLPAEDWFRQPTEGVTHIAWQVGHLAAAQYALALRRIRGEREEDAVLISPNYRKLFGKGSQPSANPADYPAVEEIRSVFDRVHQQVLHELQELPDTVLDEPAAQPAHPLFRTKFGSLMWCAEHEFVHAGQIGLLRRLFGAGPLR